jgi:hypothetical protein
MPRSLKSIGLSLTLVGFVMLTMVIVSAYYRKLFSDEETTEVEATVKNIRQVSSQPYNRMVNLSVQYCYSDKTYTAHHYTQVPEGSVDFRKGDTITIDVHPKHPKVFRLRSTQMDDLEERMKKNSVLIAVLGGILLLAGIIVLTVALLS